MLGQTPMMKQYHKIKLQYPDTILFFRLGDFYEMFGPDAELASRELEITLTGRDAGEKQRIPMCGVPYHAADNYIARLIQKGYKVAICEQVEDPKKSKGIVKREVIRVITPGTNLDSQVLQSSSSNYLAAIIQNANIWGLAFCDVSTGDFWVAEFKGEEGTTALKDELCRLNPVEVLIPANDIQSYQQLNLFWDQQVITAFKDEAFVYGKARETLLKHFAVTSLESFGCDDLRPAICSAGAIFSYLEETQMARPQQIKILKRYSSNSCMLIDATTFRNLELVRTIRFNEKKGTLLDVMDKTKTALGLRLLKLWLERPLTDKKSLEKRYSAVENMGENWAERQEIRNCLEQIYDLERLMTRVIYGRSLPKELIALKKSLAVLPQIKKLLQAFQEADYLKQLYHEFDILEDIYQLLEKAIENDPPFNLKDGGVIKTGYREEIDKLRFSSRHGKEWIARLENEEKEKTGIKSLKVGYNKVFGYYFEVTKANLNLVPEYFQRKQTLANGERYVTEELIRLENQVLGSEEKLLALEEEIYAEVLLKIGQAVERVQHTSQVLAQLDVLQSLAELAVQNDFIRPQLLAKEKNCLIFEDLRHPVVEKLGTDSFFVPNDLDMPADTNLFVITGPNMGGKSTYCRSVALAVIMAQAGSFVPAKKAVISLRDRVFARVGASDDLRSGQSTFMVEMNEVANILHHATPHSLVILDEVGRGTSTYDGLSVAWAVSEYLVKVLGTKTLFATHYHELTELENQHNSIKNLSLAVKEKGHEIILLHKIISGPADKSYGIQVSRLAGLPDPVIRRAQEILETLEVENMEQDVRKINLAQKRTSEKPAVSRDSMQDNIYRQTCHKLAEIDLFNMTPIQALNRLAELQETVKKAEQSPAAK